jgi:hypothetical protein
MRNVTVTLAVWAIACSGAATAPDAVTDATDAPGDASPCPATLAFADPTAPAFLHWGKTLDLRVAVRRCGAPATGEAVRFEVLDDSWGIVALDAPVATTDGGGIATGVLRSLRDVNLQIQVRACLDADPSVPCLTFVVVNESPGCYAPLTVTFAEYGDPAVDTADVFLFLRDADGKPGCADLDPLALPVAQVVQKDVSVGGAAVFSKLPGLEKDKEQAYTIVGLGREGAGGPIRATACDDVRGWMEWGAPTHVELVLEDVDPEWGPPLTVRTAPYAGAYPQLDVVQVLLFRQGPGGKPNCDELKLEALPTAHVASKDYVLGSDVTFWNLPGLEDDKTQTYSVLVMARTGSNGPIQAWACDDANGVVTWNGHTVVEVALRDVPPRLSGAFEVVTSFDFGADLPDAVADAVRWIADMRNDPASGLVRLACDPGCAAMSPSVCDAWKQIEGEPGPEADASDLLAVVGRFEVVSAFTFAMEPAPDGILPANACKEVWGTARFRFTDGTLNEFDLATVTGIPVAWTPFPGTFGPDPADGAWPLSIGQHAIGPRYGATLAAVLEKWMLPRLFGDGSDGLPPVDSWEAAMASRLAGNACLLTNDCCERFAKAAAGGTGAVTENLVEDACEALVQSGAACLRDRLSALDATPSGLAIGTKTPCLAWDETWDMRVDGLGWKNEPCEWDAHWFLGGSDLTPVGTFVGKAK